MRKYSTFSTKRSWTKRFSERASIDVHTTVCLEELTHTVACLAYYACAVALVDHHQCIVLLSEVADLVDRGNVAVHREDTIGDDNAETLGLGFLQAFLQLGHVGIGIAIALGLAETHTVNDRGMIERIADDGILFGEERFEHAAIGIEAGGIENGVLGLEVIGDGGLQFLMDVLRAADKTH